VRDRNGSTGRLNGGASGQDEIAQVDFYGGQGADIRRASAVATAASVDCQYLGHFIFDCGSY
jgi:hypothetical protein